MLDGKLGSISNKRFVIIRFRQIKAAKIQASLDNISYNENVGLSPMIPTRSGFTMPGIPKTLSEIEPFKLGKAIEGENK